MSSHGTVMSLNAERVQAVDPGFDELVAAIRAVRPRLVDAWEATALIESLGYTDARIRREFGVSDMAGLSAYVFGVVSHGPQALAQAADLTATHPFLRLIDAVGASLV